MIDEFKALAQGLDTLTTLVKAKNTSMDLDDVVSVLVKIGLGTARFYAVILEAQERQAALAKRVSELEKEVTRLKEWNREAQRYELYAPMDGGTATVYRLKPECEQGEAPHYLCAHCFENQEKS